MSMAALLLCQSQKIEQVLQRLDDILDHSLRNAHRIGYFAALHERVTGNVRRALIAGNVFTDPERTECFQVAISSQFLDAWDAVREGRARPGARAWTRVFDVLDDPDVLAMQHLQLGIKVQLELDLGVALAAVCPTRAELAAFRDDYDRVVDLVARLGRAMEEEVAEISPRLRRRTEVAPELEENPFAFGMDPARASAWTFARTLVEAPRGDRDALIEARDLEVAAAADAILSPAPPLSRFIDWVREAESPDVRRNIQVIAE